ncbi:hypothetical protein AAFF_G00084460, partial [Aldrovandia affinis]
KEWSGTGRVRSGLTKLALLSFCSSLVFPSSNSCFMFVVTVDRAGSRYSLESNVSCMTASNPLSSTMLIGQPLDAIHTEIELAERK